MKFEIVGQEGVKKEEEPLKVRLHVDKYGDLCFQVYIKGDWIHLCWIVESGKFYVKSVNFEVFEDIGITKGN